MSTLVTPISLITGGSRGLGRNTALHLARQGGDVVITYRQRADEAATLVAEVQALGRRALALPLDTADTARFPAFVDALREGLQARFGRTQIDHLVNNAGTGLHRPFAETREAEFDALVGVHLKGVYFLTQALLPLIADGGRIVNLSSGLARFALPGASAYAMMKGGIEVFTRYLAKELAPRGITVNTVAPGAIATDFNGGRVRDDAQMQQLVGQMTALGRAGVPDDIGPVIAALLSDSHRWVTAQRIEVSGGMLI
jgi:NAD(P)-dependent dehydrogenase (short-subunit alcohol dehydrogenase family)